MTAYYNEYDAAAAAILVQQIADGVIAPGIVDTRSIKEVQFDDIRGFDQYHWFAGGGLWSVAARRAGWEDARPIWSASCPCQPFSAAGKGGGTDDPRHLWPDLLRLIRAARAAGDGPSVLVGEQVSGAAGYGWFDGVRADLAAEDYASRSRDFPACAVDAPHQRNRLYWCAVADAIGGERDGRAIVTERRPQGRDASVGTDARSGGVGVANDEIRERGAGLRETGPEQDGDFASDGDGACPACGGRGRIGPFFPGGISAICGNCRSVDQADASRVGRGEGRPEHGRSGVTLGDAFCSRLEGHARHGDYIGRPEQDRPVATSDDARTASGLGDGAGRSGPSERERETYLREARGGQHRGPDGRNGTYWSDAEWIVCHDGKARRAKPGLRLLVDGLPGRVDLWRVGGNAIVPEAAVEVIAALREVLDAERVRLTGVFA